MVIELKDALREMDLDKPFKIQWVTHNRATGLGGEVRELKSAQILRKSPNPNTSRSQAKTPANRKSPNHFFNGTRNIQCLETGEKKKVSIWLITEFNGRKVVH